MDRASRLLNGLGGERSRWQETAERLGRAMAAVFGDTLVAAGCVTYLGPFDLSIRDRCVQSWAAAVGARGIPRSAEFSLQGVLADPVRIRGWMANRLPSDQMSVDSAVIADQSDRFPLFIDPQGQANRWIRRAVAARLTGSGRQLQVARQSQPGFARTLANAVQYGGTLLVENLPEDVDPVLLPLLRHGRRAAAAASGGDVVRVGDATVSFEPTFELFLTTKLRNPALPADVAVAATVLNFVATPEGVQGQMLALVVAEERPELEARREQLLLEDAAHQLQLQEVREGESPLTAGR